mmetsp:Transcript_2199/g.4887  ORF Transcript_2199/g.4887 Transcript_2199/m.4887 type:complete len:196 (-) Transcript_2199:39-626(-)|eukprot:CAMPEP_0182544422 /NCGR_PEP_ID=MMETSP1323-20130603/33116_1 /TAXON_ID=236787 /ORGANISM="Florenciella parvula, Strain RCC1693" /LENGTH=195 /DNA_ID=CAMNT_0024755459 /DNA_START=135 /DNA_END=722 /DNA_ORIENTATION=+
MAAAEKFVWVKFGDMNNEEHAKGQSFNVHCNVNIFLDAVRMTAKRTVEDYARTRDAQLKRFVVELSYEKEQIEAKITRQEREATEEETAAIALLDEKLAIRQKQLEELVEGITKYKGLSGNALTALKIDLLNEGGSKVNMSDEANATKYAYEVLDAKKTYSVVKLDPEGEEQQVELSFSVSADPVDPDPVDPPAA